MKTDPKRADPGRAPGGNPEAAHGLALVMTLWCTALLTLLAMGYTQGRRVELLAARELTGGAQARALAEAGVWRAAWELLLPRRRRAWHSNGRPNRLLLGKHEVLVRIHSEGGKISLNNAPPVLLEGLLRAAGLPGGKATELAQAILDWRDTDQERHPRGAEAPDYRAANRRPPRDGPFLATAELRQVLGMQAEIYRLIAPAVTAYGTQAGLEPEHASRIALAALPGMTPQSIDLYLQERLVDPWQARQLLPEQAQPYLRAATEHTMFIRSRARHGGTLRELHALLRRREDEPGFEILDWHETIPAGDQDSEWTESSSTPATP